MFALNSAVHSYLILAYAEGDKVAMNVGFYYMANAGGRLAARCSRACSTSGTASRPACGRPPRSSSAAGALSLLLPASPPPAESPRDEATERMQASAVAG